MTSAPAPAIARPPAAIEVPTSPTAGSAATRQQIRGSSLLLTGRLLSLAVNFATQVLIVRYLSKTDFGAFAHFRESAVELQPVMGPSCSSRKPYAAQIPGCSTKKVQNEM